MASTHDIVMMLTAGGTGTLLGLGVSYLTYRVKVGSYHKLSSEILERAEREAAQIVKDGELMRKQAELEQRRELDKLLAGEQRKLQKEQDRLTAREEKLDDRERVLEKRSHEYDVKEKNLLLQQQALAAAEEHCTTLQNSLTSELEKVAGLSRTEAKESILKRVADTLGHDAALLTRRSIEETRERAETEARRIITTAIERISVPHVSEVAVTTVAIGSDEMKARIIGREGRNIRAFEKATGTSIIVDETPDAIVLSAMDPVRRHIAKVALTELISDGRIHPTRIEEAVNKAEKDVENQTKAWGEDAALRAGVIDLHAELIALLGRLKFRTSFGQNVLEHSLEVAHLAGLMAAELGLDTTLAKRMGILHDIGKALSQEMDGSHAVVGHNMALKFGESDAVANGIGSHHHEMEPMTVEACLVASADAISASRPGARIEAVQEYVKRLRKLEEIAREFPGVDKAYCVQAGRELRVIVLPEMIDDDGTVNLARDVTKKIQTHLHAAGKIKVTVLREKRVVEYVV